MVYNQFFCVNSAFVLKDNEIAEIRHILSCSNKSNIKKFVSYTAKQISSGNPDKDWEAAKIEAVKPVLSFNCEVDVINCHIDINPLLRYSSQVIDGKWYPNEGHISYLASWKFFGFPGCCGIAISSDARINAYYQNLGLGTLVNNIRQRIIKDCRYSLLVCTDIATNEAQQKVLTKNNWQAIKDFRNSRTDNKVIIHCKDL